MSKIESGTSTGSDLSKEEVSILPEASKALFSAMAGLPGHELTHFHRKIHWLIEVREDKRIVLPEHGFDTKLQLSKGEIRDLGRRAYGALFQVFTRLAAETSDPCMGSEREHTVIRDGKVLDLEGPQILKALQASTDPNVAGRSVPELRKSQIEDNVPKIRMGPDLIRQSESAFRDYDRTAQEIAKQWGATICGFAAVPSIGVEDLNKKFLTESDRFRALAAAVQAGLEEKDLLFDRCFKTRRGQIITSFNLDENGGGEVKIVKPDGEVFCMSNTSVLLESLMTGLQVHIPVADQEEYVGHHRVADMLVPALIGISAASPLICMEETGFVDSRNGFLWHTGVSPWRVGMLRSNWIADPLEQLRDAAIAGPFISPSLGGKLKGGSSNEDLVILHETAKTIWPHNRTTLSPIFDPESGEISESIELRIESRSMSAGPTTTDEIAHTLFNTAAVLGLYRSLKERGVDIDAREHEKVSMELHPRKCQLNIVRTAVDGLDAQVDWIGGDQMTLGDLIRSDLLPIAKRYLAKEGNDPADIDRVFASLEQRLSFDWSKVEPAAPPSIAQKFGMCPADVILYMNHTLPLLDP
ncbi:MAG: hypothetical protein KDD62_07910, partial [Bdellovibrionales bacterium]|nr:hypothetical protein [Bdellovibrionales bacterium]